MRLGPVRLFLVLILLMAAVLAWLWVDQQGQWRNLTWSSPKALPPDLKVPISGSLANGPAGAEFAAIQARPIFAPDRRPPPPPAPPAAEPPPDPLANIQIQGIFSGKVAGVIARVDGKVRRIMLHETVGPWTLKNIEGREITFGQGNDSRKLRLDYARLGQPAPQATATSAPAAQSPGNAVTGAAAMPQNVQDEIRDRVRRRNELRASRGLPPFTE
ncbi:MAG: hypothetical protein WAV85_18700 [Rhodoferax sp.]